LQAGFGLKKEQQMQRILAERELTSEGPRHRRPARRNRRSATLNLAESPLAWLYARGHLPERPFFAGEKLRADFEQAGLAPSVTMRWDPVRLKGGPGAGGSPTERQLSAKRRFDGAMAAAGAGLDDVLWRVVCACESLPQAERALDWPVRSGKLVLRLALDRVADFYRLPGA
jgi:hypothetical protein